MQNQPTNKPEITAVSEVKGQKPWPVIIMLSMLFTVIISGFILVPRTEEAKLQWLSLLGTSNNGELLNPPIELTDRLLDSEGNSWVRDREVPWKIVLVNRGACEQSCQDLADLTARVHARTNEMVPNIKRGYLSIGPNAGGEKPPEVLNYQNLQTSGVDLPALLTASGAPDLADGPLVLIVNPLQVAFIYYTAAHEGAGMLEDLEHVIKLSK